MRALDLSWDLAQQMMGRPDDEDVDANLREVGVEGPADILARYRVGRDQILQITADTGYDPRAAAAALVEAANAVGGDDNITVIAVQLQSL